MVGEFTSRALMERLQPQNYPAVMVLGDTAGGDQLSPLFGNFWLGYEGYLAILGQIVLIAAVTALASRRTVNHTLETVE